MMVVAVVLRPPQGPTPGFEHATINKHSMRQDYVVKTRKSYHYLFYLATLRHDTSMNRRP